MDKITQLVATLTEREKQALGRFYSLKKQGEHNMRWRLFKLIENNLSISDKEAAAFFTKKPSDTSFSMLKRRLKDDIIKVLVWEQKSSSFKSAYFKARFECRILIAEAEILAGRGANLLAIEQLYKAKKLSEKFELTNEAIVVNEQLITFVAIREGFQTYSRFANDSKEQFQVIQDKFQAQDYLRQLTIPNLFHANKEYNYREKAKEANAELKNLSERTDSIEVRFWYLRSEVFYNHLQKDYNTSFEFARKFLSLVEESKVLYSIDNMGGANMQLAMICIFRGDFLNAVQYASVACSYFTKGSTNYVNASDVLFLGLFYQDKLDQAKQVLAEMMQNKNVAKNHMLRSKWIYYQAQILFCEKEYSEALALLQQQTELFNDKSGWRLGIKILEMMCIVEMKNDDWLDYRIETFRKLLSDLKKENIVRPKAIYQVFKAYIRSAYQWDVVCTRMATHLDILHEAKGDHYWDPVGYEMIRFDAWVREKMKIKRRLKV